MYRDRRNTFVNICADMLFQLQWLIKKDQFNTLDLGVGLMSMPPLRLIVKQPKDIPVISI